jgi:hypothetical protein
MLEVYFYVCSSFTIISSYLNNEVVGTRDFENVSSYLLARVEGPPLHEAQQVPKGFNPYSLKMCRSAPKLDCNLAPVL